MVKILLIRHGQSEANLAGFFAGQMDSPTTALGEHQASCVAKYIAENYKVNAIYSSDLQRAAVVGNAVAGKTGAPLYFDSRLREINSGKWQGLSFEKLIAEYPSYQVWLHDIGNAHCDGGESVSQMQMRVLSVVKEIAQKYPNQTVVITTHATPIRALQCCCDGKSLSDMKDVPWVSNSSITELIYGNDSFSFGKIGCDEYLADAVSRFPNTV